MVHGVILHIWDFLILPAWSTYRRRRPENLESDEENDNDCACCHNAQRLRKNHACGQGDIRATMVVLRTDAAVFPSWAKAVLFTVLTSSAVMSWREFAETRISVLYQQQLVRPVMVPLQTRKLEARDLSRRCQGMPRNCNVCLREAFASSVRYMTIVTVACMARSST